VLRPHSPLNLDPAIKSFFGFLLPYMITGQVVMGFRRVIAS
jgi:hypothetical protein